MGAVTFKSVAKGAGFFASGGGTEFRIAVTGKRMFASVAALAAREGATVAPSKGAFPELVKITFPEAAPEVVAA